MTQIDIYKYLEHFRGNLYRIKPDKKQEFCVRMALLGIDISDRMVRLVFCNEDFVNPECVLREIKEKHETVKSL